jgi:glycerophosphoryl diester phosphodiesterase
MVHGLTEAALALVAHRGDRAGGAENTLAAFAFAAAAGARFAECDIRFTRDFAAVALHDNRLRRLCSRPDVKADEVDLAELRLACSHCFELLTLEMLAQWLQSQPQLTMFVEIKPMIRRRLSDQGIAERLADSIPESLFGKIVLISQSGAIVDACKARFDCRTGWVGEGRQRPETPVDYIFMPHQKAVSIAAWHARGARVVLYTVNQADRALQLLSMGADLIETDHYARMAQDIG